MAEKRTSARTRRAKGQAQWLREQIDKERPGWNPVLEMVQIVHKERISKRDKERFPMLIEIARYVQPKLKMVEVEHGVAGGDGEVTIRWKE